MKIPEQYSKILKERAEHYKGVKHEFQGIGKDMQEFFPKSQNARIWASFYKYKLEDIKYAFNVCKDRNVQNMSYLIGVIKRK